MDAVQVEEQKTFFCFSSSLSLFLGSFIFHFFIIRFQEMYNGVGITTPRGSGTSGHVQKNAATVRTKTDYAEARRKEDARKEIVIPKDVAVLEVKSFNAQRLFLDFFCFKSTS